MAQSELGTKKNINILFTCIGRRVSLLNSFRKAAKELKLKACFIGTDTTPLSSALQLCDKRFIVKPVSHPGYLKHLLEIVKKNKVGLLIPTVDLDLKLLAYNKTRFAKLGCKVLVSDSKVVEICQDKRKTYRFLLKNGFDTPVTMSVKEALARKHNWPCFLKPWDGYAGRGSAIAYNRKELEFYIKKVPNPIVQEFIKGAEYTCDAYVDFNRQIRCVVPRRRIEVRGGEVSKGQVVKNTKVMKQVAELVEKLGAGAGVITIQLFVNADHKIKFIEINPRFGGGVPLSIRAGADFPKWILQTLSGRRVNIKFSGFKDGLVMLRYDSEVWLENHRHKKGR